MASNANENERNCKIFIIYNFEEQEKKWSGDMVERYLSAILDVNSFDDIREKRVLQTDKRTDGRTEEGKGRLRHDSSFAVPI